VRWTIVLPLKGGTTAKSRLGADPAVARAVAADTLEAVIACRAVSRTIVVTPHSRTAVESARAGAVVIGESRPGQGLVAAVRDGIAAAGAGPVGVLLGDLPAHPAGAGDGGRPGRHRDRNRAPRRPHRSRSRPGVRA
jgi:2-phospho-L-lactate guanylyltransferase